MFLAILAVAIGLAVLVWSSDRFVGGSAMVARYFHVPPLLIGMVVVGFGTSAPELTVSALASIDGASGIALGNAYGSNITNIALILGITALISPITFQSAVLRKELPILTGVTAIAAWQLRDGTVSRIDAAVLLTIFAGLLAWTIRQGMKTSVDPLGTGMEQQLENHEVSLRRATVSLGLGLMLLIVSSQTLVWGAIEIAHILGVSDLIIGLTVVAIGTSLPELASSIAAIRKREHDIALGNVLGSNLFNTLAVVGLAGIIRPISVGPEVFSRDIPVVAVLTISLFVIGYGFRRPGRIDRTEGVVLLSVYVVYIVFLIRSVVV